MPLMRSVDIRLGPLTLKGELFNTPTAGAIWKALPLTAPVNRWGNEIYFEIPVTLTAELGAKRDVAVGDLAYWPEGRCFCICQEPPIRGRWNDC